MGKYADVKSKQFVKLLRWLHENKSIELTRGGNHNLKVICINTDEAYPIASSHSYINKHIVKHFKEWLIQRDVCTEAEFDSRL